MTEKNEEETLEETLNELFDEIESYFETGKDNFKEVKRQLNTQNSTLRKFMTNIEKKIVSYERMLKNYEANMTVFAEHAANVDQTLCNVLLAIRQNEYLQAWYPEQRGEPEMKVVGKHPKTINWGDELKSKLKK